MGQIDTLLHRLDKVKQTGTGKYMACCPAHYDKSPSLSIKEADSGKVLIHCFAGCHYADVLDAVGLRPSDLFPDSLPRTSGLSVTKRRQYRDALDLERHIVAIVQSHIEQGREISEEDCQRGILAIDRIFKIQGALNEQ